MDIELISEGYRAEMTGAFGRLAEMVREGRLSPGGFMRAQVRVYESYKAASDLDRLARIECKVKVWM